MNRPDRRDPFLVAFGRAVAERREERGWTRADLAMRARLCRQTLVAIEDGVCGFNFNVTSRVWTWVGGTWPEVTALWNDVRPAHLRLTSAA